MYFICSLRISCMHTLYFDDIYPCFPLGLLSGPLPNCLSSSVWFFYTTHWVLLVLPICTWVWSHPLEDGHGPHPWRKPTLPHSVAINCQSFLSWGWGVLWPFLPDSRWSFGHLTSCWLCASSHRCRGFMNAMAAVVQQTLYHPKSSHPLFLYVPRALGRESVVEISHLELRASSHWFSALRPDKCLINHSCVEFLS